MPQHYTRDTESAQIFCGSCMSTTTWRVLGGKRAFCIPCYEASAAVSRAAAARAAAAEPVAVQQGLFDVEAVKR
jgi:hypothetical protein